MGTPLLEVLLSDGWSWAAREDREAGSSFGPTVVRERLGVG